MSDKESSTAKSYLDSAVGAAQSAFGNLTGNTEDQVRQYYSLPHLSTPPPFYTYAHTLQAKGEAHKARGAAEGDASHTAGKAGPISFTSSGGVATDDQRRTQGQYDQTVGSAKETLGNLVGAEGLKRDGAEQNAMGKGTEAEGQLADFGSGVADRVKGAVGGATAGLTGDREKQQQYQLQHDDGKAAQRGAEIDIQKQNS